MGIKGLFITVCILYIQLINLQYLLDQWWPKGQRNQLVAGPLVVLVYRCECVYV